MKTGKGRLRAQAMLEFALALPIFLLVVYGIMEAGRAIFMYAGVTTAAKEAARYAAASGINADGNLHYQDCVAIRTAARNVGFLLNLPTDSTTNITIKYTIAVPPSSTITKYCTKTNTGPQIDILPNNGDNVTVTVTKQFNPIVKLVPFTSFPMQATSSRTLTGTIDMNPPTPGP